MEDATTPDERADVRAAQAGDLEAFRRLYERHVHAVHGFAGRRAGQQAAEDLTAETFLRAFERIGGYQERGIPFRAWLLRFAYHLVVDRSRRRSSSDVLVPEPEAGAVQGPEDEVVAGLEAHRLLAALGTLPAAQQHVLDLRYLRELSVAETAAVLGSTPEAVRALTYRALRTLRRAYDPAGDEPWEVTA